MKIPFDIKYRPQIESGEYKVETRDGRPVEIISFELTDTNGCPIAAKFRLCAGTPVVYLFDENGEYRGEGASDYDIFIITPEPELTEWQRSISTCLQKHGLLDCGSSDRIAKESAAELLDIARKEIIGEWSKGLRDTQDLSGKAYSDGYNFGSKFGYERGKAEALKELPRWKKCGVDTGQTNLIRGYSREEDELYRNGKCISLVLLEKLPGFKEDEK